MMDRETELRVKYCGMKQSELAKAAIKLEKEADWLAQEITRDDTKCIEDMWPCSKYQEGKSLTVKDCKECWREAARKATEGK